MPGEQIMYAELEVLPEPVWIYHWRKLHQDQKVPAGDLEGSGIVAGKLPP